MGRLSAALRRTGRVLIVAALLYAAVFVARLIDPTAGSGVGFLYVIPIALVAIELGRTAGVVAGVVAVGLFAVWAQVTGPDVGFLAYASRGTGYVLVGGLVGQLSDRLRRTAAEAEAGARHFELSRDLMCTASFDGYFVHLNGSWEQVLGWSREELLSRPYLDFVHPDDRARSEAEAAAAEAGSFSTSFTNRYRTKDGDWRWIEWSSKTDAAHRRIHAVARDVTERIDADRARKEAEARFTRAFEDSAVGMALVGVEGDERNVILAANGSLARMLGLPRDDVVGKVTLSELADPDDRPAIAKGMQRLEDGDAPLYRGEFRIVRPDGRRIWVDTTASIVRDEAGNPLYRLSQVVDIDARRRAEEQLRYLADHDPLSGVYNRRRFEQELERELGHAAMRGARGCVLVLDVDGFKQINDTVGHAAGDAVIARIGHALTDRVRSSDVVGRLGGDEFGVLLRRVKPEEAMRIAESVQSVTTEGLAELAHSGSDTITLSVGVATFGGEDVPSLDELLSRADAAMYEAKRAGGDQLAGVRAPGPAAAGP